MVVGAVSHDALCATSLVAASQNSVAREMLSDQVAASVARRAVPSAAP